MIVCEFVNGAWSEFSGSPRKVTVGKETILLDPAKVKQLVAQGVWGVSDVETYGLRLASPFVVPEGKQIVGDAAYSMVNDELVQKYAVEDVPVDRRRVLKSTVQQRLIDAGLMGKAYVALTANPVYFARWFAPDHPTVYADDPDALTLLDAIGADAAVIMAPDEKL
jgi:hypothetical protein